jgi:hypothetical protein
MDTVEHDAWIVVEDILRAVAVMHVPIDDQDARQAECRLRVFGRQGDVVEQAKTHAPLGRGVMPRRPHQA